jgi:aerobic-type carbon monoxide dehydrogenase small subunit (CoxS/CutS family)
MAFVIKVDGDNRSVNVDGDMPLLWVLRDVLSMTGTKFGCGIAQCGASVIVLPGDTPHFHWAKSGEYVTQVSAIGPLGLEYLNPGDDPHRQHRHAS